MGEDGPPDEMDEAQMRYDSGGEWEERLREEGAAGEDADEWGWSRCQLLTHVSLETSFKINIYIYIYVSSVFCQ